MEDPPPTPASLPPRIVEIDVDYDGNVTLDQEPILASELPQRIQAIHDAEALKAKRRADAATE